MVRLTFLLCLLVLAASCSTDAVTSEPTEPKADLAFGSRQPDPFLQVLDEIKDYGWLGEGFAPLIENSEYFHQNHSRLISDTRAWWQRETRTSRSVDSTALPADLNQRWVDAAVSRNQQKGVLCAGAVILWLIHGSGTIMMLTTGDMSQPLANGEWLTMTPVNLLGANAFLSGVAALTCFFL